MLKMQILTSRLAWAATEKEEHVVTQPKAKTSQLVALLRPQILCFAYKVVLESKH